jgi:hypothetical protein
MLLCSSSVVSCSLVFAAMILAACKPPQSATSSQRGFGDADKESGRVVEGYIARSPPALVMGVQFHPERPFADARGVPEASSIPLQGWREWFGSDSRRLFTVGFSKILSPVPRATESTVFGVERLVFVDYQAVDAHGFRFRVLDSQS